MKITNKSKKAVIASDAVLCRDMFSKGIGLMFQANPRSLIFAFKKEKKVPLHMLFVFFPIDVLFLSKKKEVVEIKESFKPWTFYNPKNKAQYVVELPKGSIKSSRTKVGDKLEF